MNEKSNNKAIGAAVNGIPINKIRYAADVVLANNIKGIINKNLNKTKFIIFV